MNRVIALWVCVLTSLLAGCAPGTDAITVERSSQCISPNPSAQATQSVTDAINGLNATTSAGIAKLEYTLSEIDSDVDCGTVFYSSATQPMRVVRVYQVVSSQQAIAAKLFTLRALLRELALPPTSRVVVYTNPTDDSPSAFIKTGWNEPDVSSTLQGLRSESYTDGEDTGSYYSKLALQRQSLFISDSGNSTSGQSDLLNCADFSSQAAAQAFFGGSSSDPNRLDADNDGMACEVQTNASSTYRVATAPAQPAQPTVATPSPSYSSGRCYVSSYTRSNGTRVSGYYRRC